MGKSEIAKNNLHTYCIENNLNFILDEWHPTKNGNLTPLNITIGSEKKVWWMLHYDDLETGKHFDFEWQMAVCSRVRGRNCPYLSGQAVWKGYNDLQTLYPKLASEWHPTKNGSLTPSDVTVGSNKKVWWLFPFDDIKTGKHFDFEWETTIGNRVNRTGCPYLSGRAIWKGYNDLGTTHPELTKEWHPTKNGNLKPADVTAGSRKKVWWFLPFDDTNTGKHFDFEWESTISHRTNGRGCPYLSNSAVWRGFNDLQTTNPELAAEWHPTKNGDLKPTDITAGSRKKVWWFLPFDDTNTGKHFDFEWETEIVSRVNGGGCPYLSGQAVWKGYNDLQTLYPKLASEWHPTKNGDLKPSDVTAKSGKKVWWLFPFDDPKTGKHFDFEWKTTVFDRMDGCGCPYISGRAVYKGFNDLQTVNPKLASEWHPTKNGNLTPSDVTAGSNKKVWWLLPYDCPKTGKHFDFEWEATISDRTTGNGCPYLSNRLPQERHNDLQTENPELAAEWHPTKNGDLKPTDVTAGSGQKVWWYGKCKHEWQATVASRKISGCPICAHEKHTSFPEQAVFYYIKKGFPDAVNGTKEILDGKELDIYIPSRKVAIEYDGQAWHQNNERDEIKNKLCQEQGIELYRIREKECYFWDETDYLKLISCTPNNMTELENAIKHIYAMLNVPCPKINIDEERQIIYNQYIKKKKDNSLAVKYPEIAKEWHPTKNGNLTPYDVSFKSNKKVWWLLSHDDSITGKHFDFEWESTVGHRVSGNGCPYLTGRYAWEGFNNLKTTNPELATEWHPTKNGGLKPTDVTAGSGQKVWWLLSYDCPTTGKHFDFEWKATINSRASGKGCPYLAGRCAWEGFNDLKTTNPELAAEWHPTKNGDLKPTDVTAGSGQKVWWLLPYDDSNTGKHFDFEWEAKISNRTIGRDCPYLSNKKVWVGFNDLATTHPELAEEWNYEKNGKLTPKMVSYGTDRKVWWQKHYDEPHTGKHFLFEWKASVTHRTKGEDCPYLSGKSILKGFNDLETLNPELVAEWHPTKNGNLKPADITIGSGKKVWWLLPYDCTKTGKHFDFEWEAKISSRISGRGCPYLSNYAVWQGFNDLETYCIENNLQHILEEWNYVKNNDLKPTDIYYKSDRKVWWTNSNGQDFLSSVFNRIRASNT